MHWGLSKIFKYRAKCPECGRKVPLWWWLFARTRACPTCSRLIRPIPAWDNWKAVELAVLSLLLIGIALRFTYDRRRLPEGFPAVRFAGGAVLVLLIHLVLYPFLTPYEAVSTTPTCQSCGYDLRATPDRCPECGAIPGKGKSYRDAGSSDNEEGADRMSDS